jgi:hypothetical protein
MTEHIRKVTVWPRKRWLPPSLIDLAYALQRAARFYPARASFTAAELFADFAGPSPAVASRVARDRSAQLQSCLRSLGLELVDQIHGAFTIRRRPALVAPEPERSAA